VRSQGDSSADTKKRKQPEETRSGGTRNANVAHSSSSAETGRREWTVARETSG